jgi:cell division protein FtsL
LGWAIEKVFTELPLGVAIAMGVFLGILLMIWLLLPLWVLFIQWNTTKIRDEIRNLADQLERKQSEEGEMALDPKE